MSSLSGSVSVSGSTTNEFINYVVSNGYTIWNVTNKKMPLLPSGVSWSKCTINDYTVNLNSDSFGFRTGKQENGKYIIGLDFDMYVKINKEYEECKNTRILYKKFEKVNEGNDGVFISSTENNRGVLVDITECEDLIDLIELDGRGKIQKKNYCLEVLTSFNMVIPPTTTICKIRGQALTPRAFLSDKYFLELKENTDVYDFIYNYISEAKETKNVSSKNLKKHKKVCDYNNLVDDIEEDKVELDTQYIKPFLKLLSNDRISNYNTWFKIGMALKNICNDEEGLKLFKFVSSLDKDNYNENSVKYYWKVWNNYKDVYDGLNHNYILHCANNDNPNKFYVEFVYYLESTKEAQYKEKLIEFEKEVKYVLHPPMYLVKDDYLDKWNIYKQEDLKNIFKVKYGKDFIKRYIDDEDVKYYSNMDFIPDVKFDNNKIYNTFEGYYIQNKTLFEDVELTNYDIIKNHINNIICDNNPNTIEFITQWLAHLVFNTTKRCGITPVIKGEQGAGKGTLYNIIDKLLGSKYCLMTSTPENDVFSRFNDMLHEKVLVNINEAEYKNFTSAMENFKSLITDNTFNMESKGVRKITLNNYLWFLITTNNEKLFNVSSKDRRFYFVESSNSKIGNKEYFDNIYEAIENDDIMYSFYKYLQSVYNPKYNFAKKRLECKTTFQEILEDVSKHPFYTFLKEYIEDKDDTTIHIKPKDLGNKYSTYCKNERTNNTETGKSIKQKLLKYNTQVYKKVKYNDEFTYYYILDKQALLNYMTNHKLV